VAGQSGDELADRTVLIARAEGVSGVLNDAQIRLPSHIDDPRHVARMAGVVHRHHSGRSVRARFTHRRRKRNRIDVQGARINVDQHRARSDVLNDVHGGAEGHRAREHAVPRSNSHRQQRQMHGSCAGAERQCRIGAHLSAEPLLEKLRLGSSRDPSRSQGTDHFSNLVLPDGGLGERQR
jgi:hypothetical protein